MAGGFEKDQILAGQGPRYYLTYRRQMRFMALGRRLPVNNACDEAPSGEVILAKVPSTHLTTG